MMTCPNWLKWFLFPVFNPYLISWLIGMNPIAQWNGCPISGFSGDMAEDSPGPGMLLGFFSGTP